MIFSIFLVLLLGCCNFVASDDKNLIAEKCPYETTVDLTNQQRFENGSYVYEDILIPTEKQAYYDYHLMFRKENVSVPRHLRGCVCTSEKSCIKLCCEIGDFYNTSSYKCEQFSDEVSWNLPIQLDNDEVKTVNVIQQFIYQVGVPCKRPEALISDLDNWILLEDGVLFVEYDDSQLNTLDYCFTPYKFNDTEEYLLTPLSCPIKNVVTWSILLNTYAMTVSVLFLIPTIVVYTVLKELRGNLRGKLLICYLLSLTMGYAIISYINISDTRFSYIACSLLGYTCYFFFMAAFLWLSVLCYDIWINFKDTNVQLNSRKNWNQFIWYSLYAWGLSSICTCLVLIAQLSSAVPNIYKPDIGVEICWLNTDKWAAGIYFYGPNLIILIFNFVTFAHLTMRIYKVRRDLAKMTHRERFFQENGIVILRLFLIMGVSWLFDILSYCLRNFDNAEFIFLLSDFGNAIQGLLIFTLFVMKPNVLNLLKKRFNLVQTDKPSRSVSSTTNSSKLQTATSIQSTQPLVSRQSLV